MRWPRPTPPAICAALALLSLAPRASASTCAPPTVDWSNFPGGYQCIVGVQKFTEAQWGAPIPATGGAPPNGGCAALGACLEWVDDLPDPGIWERHAWGSIPAQAYDVLIFPPTASNAYGHAAMLDHVDGNGTVWVMDDNWDGQEHRSCAWAGHDGWVHSISGYAPYGFYRLKALCDGQTRACGSDVGECKHGTQTCANGVWGGCVGGVGPSPEVCDGRDNDCNGAVDENLVQSCGSDVGECKQGTQVCTGGAWGACEGGVLPTPEVCDGRDNDCDGAVDDHEVCELDEAVEAHLYDVGPSSDVDGDGRADACAHSDAGLVCDLSMGHAFGAALVAPASDGAEWAARSVFTTLRMGDVDGDGRADACVREAAGVACWMSQGHGLGRRIVGPALADGAGWDDVARFSTIRLADIDGDGRADLCARGAEGFTCSRSTGAGFEPWRTLAALSDAEGFSDVNRYATVRMGDIDGDGRADVCARLAGGMSCWRSTPNGFSERIVGPAWSDAAGFGAWQRWSTIRLADVNGDGRADLCALEPAGWTCYLSDGAGFGERVAGPALADEADPARRDRFGSMRLGDLDGDGAADVCARGASGVTCWLWSGHGFDRQVAGPPLTDADGWDEPARYRTLRLADVNGDGHADLCGRTASGLVCWAFEGGGFVERVLGPTWSDDAGWGAEPRYDSIRISGPGAARRGPRQAVGSGGASPAAAPETPGANDDNAIVGACTAAPTSRGRDPDAIWLALGGLGLAAVRRARRVRSRLGRQFEAWHNDPPRG
jgi:hypothetical protein